MAAGVTRASQPRVRVDIALLLGLTSTGARVLLVLFLSTQVALAFASGGDARGTWQSVVALVAVGLAAARTVLPGRFPLPLPDTIAVVGATVVSTVLVGWQIEPGIWPGYAAWHLGANTFVLLALALRGRIGSAWVGMAAMVALTVTWSLTTGQGVTHGLDLVNRQAGTLVIGTLFAVGLTRTARRISSLAEAETRQIVEQITAVASAEERDAQADRLIAVAGPSLERLARGDFPAPAEQADLLILEATLRDTVRARSFSEEPLLTETLRARQRGVDVVLLDDSLGIDIGREDRSRVAAWVEARLRATESGTFTARLSVSERSASVTVLSPRVSETLELPLREEY